MPNMRFVCLSCNMTKEFPEEEALRADCPDCRLPMLPLRAEPITDEERESWGFPV